MQLQTLYKYKVKIVHILVGYTYNLRVYEQFLPYIYRVVCNCIW